MSDAPAPAPPSASKRSLKFLDVIERLGDKLPEPVFIFMWLILALVIISVICANLGVSTVNPVTKEVLVAKSLVSTENLRTLLTEMPKTFASFPPLGIVLLVMMGAGLAERVGLFSAAIRSAMRAAPKRLLTPAVLLIGLASNHAADSGIVILPALAAVVFASVGRHPIAGIACAYSACIASFTANPLPGQFDALILGLTEPAAKILVTTWTANFAGNWYVSMAGTVLFTTVGWWVTEKIVEPRLGPWAAPEGQPQANDPLTDVERKGLRWAALAALAVAALWAALTLVPGGPLRDAQATGAGQWGPLFRSLAAAFFILFLAAGCAYGVAVGVIKKDNDVARLAADSLAGMAGYLVMVFAAAHFIAMFTWSGLGAITAIEGAEALQASHLPMPVFLIGVVFLTGALDMIIGSASAKWAVMGPVLVPMLMILGVSPEMTTAAYRAGDSTINICTPMSAYFVISLTYARRWVPSFGVGGLISALLPYALTFLGVGLVLVGVWSALELPLGPAAPFSYTLP
ncbi:AbgT family transporter [soil metagenome]